MLSQISPVFRIGLSDDFSLALYVWRGSGRVAPVAPTLETRHDALLRIHLSPVVRVDRKDGSAVCVVDVHDAPRGTLAPENDTQRCFNLAIAVVCAFFVADFADVDPLAACPDMRASRRTQLVDVFKTCRTAFRKFSQDPFALQQSFKHELASLFIQAQTACEKLDSLH